MNLIDWIFRAERIEGGLTKADKDFYDVAFGGASTASGVTVSPSKALTYAAYWRGINLISQAIAKTPVTLYERMQPIGKKRASGHPSYRLLRRSAGPDLSARTFKLHMMCNVMLHGNAYAFIARNAIGRIVELVMLPQSSSTVTVERKAGRLVYRLRWKPDGGLEQEQLAAPEEMFHIRGLGDNGVTGFSVISYAAETLGIGLALRDYGARFFSNDARPGVVLEHPGRLGKDAAQSLREQWDARHRGRERAHNVAVLQEGMKLTPFSISARDAQMIESRRFEIRDIANILGVPPHKLGDDARSSYNSLEQENQAFLDDAVDPWMTALEDEADRKLLTDRERETESHLHEFNRNAIVRVNIADRFAAYNIGIQAGILNRDEARDRENLNPIPDGSGSVFLVPLNMAPSSDLGGGGNDAPSDPDGKRAALSKLIAEQAGRACARLGVIARKLAKNGIRCKDWEPFVFDDAAEAVDLTMRSAINLGRLMGLVVSEHPARMIVQEWNRQAMATDDAPHLVVTMAERMADFEAGYPERFAASIIGD